jgi:hypothetical protein
VRALLLSIACFVSTGLGVVLVIVPVAGAVFAFGAPALALLGVILGGLDLSRLRREGKPRDVAMVGTVLSALGFFPALITALTCGVCNALVSAGPIEVQRGLRLHMGQGVMQDAGVPQGWPQAAPTVPDTARDTARPATPEPAAPGQPPTAAPASPSAPDRAGPDPATALPPPPLPAGPGARP